MDAPATAAFVPQDQAAAQQLSLEQKLDAAAAQASTIVAAFSPAAAIAIQAGVAVEPVVSGLIHMFVALFKHHAATATK